MRVVFQVDFLAKIAVVGFKLLFELLDFGEGFLDLKLFFFTDDGIGEDLSDQPQSLDQFF